MTSKVARVRHGNTNHSGAGVLALQALKPVPLEHGLVSLGTDDEGVDSVSDGGDTDQDRLAAFRRRVHVRLGARAGDEGRVEVKVGCEKER